MIDMSRLRGVWVDPVGRKAHAQAGCTLGDVDRETQLHGLAAVLGFVSATGIAGLTVGGGFGYLTRRHGWTCDNVVSMEVVTAEGRSCARPRTRTTISFWALRGGGRQLRNRHVVRVPALSGGTRDPRRSDRMARRGCREVLEAYRKFSAAAPRELTTVAVLRIAPPAPWLPKEVHGKPIVALFVCHSGNARGGRGARRAAAQARAAVADILMRRPYAQMQSLLDATQPKGRRYYWKSHYLPAIDRRAIDVAVEHAARIRSPHSAILLFQIEGAVGTCPRIIRPRAIATRPTC
jgi:hypothetical protein